MTLRVVFRVDASVVMGTGHVMRCLTLAEALRTRGAQCRFVTRALPGHQGDRIAAQGHAVTLLPAPDAQDAPRDAFGDDAGAAPAHAAWAGVGWRRDADETAAAIGAPGAQAPDDRAPDWLVVDHYAFDARWQRAVAGPGTRILAIDDLADRPHAADLLLDQNLGREPVDYDGLLPARCRRLTGPDFALLRPEFAALRPASLAARADRVPRRLLISMGGTDVVDATSRVLRALAAVDLPQGVQATVVMGGKAPALDAVRALAAALPFATELAVDAPDMARLMAEADLAIGAAGSSTWERCCMGLPSIMVQTAANQAGPIGAMIDRGASPDLGPLEAPGFKARLAAAVRAALAAPPAARAEAVARAAAICDGAGAARVAEALADRQLSVRAAGPADAEDIWRWRNDPAALAFYLNPEPTPLADHLAWFARALASDDRLLLIVEAGGRPAAHLRFDRLDSVGGGAGGGESVQEGPAAEVSICLNPAFRGRGLAAEILSTAIAAPESGPPGSAGPLYAQVHADNIASRKVFALAGFDTLEKKGDFLRLGFRPGFGPGPAAATEGETGGKTDAATDGAEAADAMQRKRSS